MLIMFLNLGLMFNFHSKAQFVKKRDMLLLTVLQMCLYYTIRVIITNNIQTL